MLIQIQNIAEMLIAAKVLSQISYCCCFPSTITQLTGVINNVFTFTFAGLNITGL